MVIIYQQIINQQISIVNNSSAQMFSSLRNYSKNIDQCQRFYYDNYDYYNIYQNLQNQYKDDLSKFIYNCNRRSTPYIVTYESQSKIKHSRLIKSGDYSMMTEQQSQQIQEQNSHKYMQDFVNVFIKIYMENNYFSLMKNNQKQAFIQPFQLLYFSPLNDQRYQNRPFKTRQLDQQQLSQYLSFLSSSIQVRIQKLQEQWSQVSNEQYVGTGRLSSVQFKFALELYSKKILKQIYQEGSDNFQLLHQFIKEVQRIIWQIMNGKIRTILLMAQPKTYYLNFIFHPLILPITTFLKFDHQAFPESSKYKSPSLYNLISSSEQTKPRIVFLNLDGKQSAHNLRTIGILGEQMLYISLYQQPSWIEKGQIILKVQNTIFSSQQEGSQVTYRRLWDLYSQQIAKQYKQVQGSSSAKILLFPLYSTYVIRKYIQRKVQKNPNIQDIKDSYQKLPKLESSNDIHSLFQHIIFQQIRMFKPTMIFISYNGQINILEEHFTDIVRNCSIISDHRVILFTNFTHYFQDQTIQISQQDQQIQKIMCSHQFYQRYFNYEFNKINEQRLYANLSLFMKYGPGLYSMQDRTYGTPSMKYNIEKLYLYLNQLSQMEEFKKLQNNIIRKWNPEQLSSLYESYRRWQIRQNKKQSKYYQNLLSTVIAELLCKNITRQQLSTILGKKLYYRYQYVLEQILREQQQLYNRFGAQMIQQQSINYFENYLQNQKQKLIAANFQNYKVKKHFYLSQIQKTFGQVSCFKFIFQNGKQRQQISLEKYSQVIINQQTEELFIINYKTQQNRHMILYGSMKNSQINIEIPVYEVEETDQQLNQVAKSSIQFMSLSQQGLVNQKQDIVFVQYNYCISHRNLYLFWPLMWNLKQQARCRLLGVQYRPTRVQKMIKVSYFSAQMAFKFENLEYEPSSNGIKILPRWGCSSYYVGDNNFLIFGGIYDNQNDFKKIGVGIYRAQIKGEGNKKKTFTITAQSKSQNGIVLNCIKPKINYGIKKSQEKGQQNIYKIFGGYGRQNTGFFNIFSYEQYQYDIRIGLKKINNDRISSRRIVNTQKPLQNQKIGKFNVITGYNVIHTEQKFSDALKDKFVFEKRIQKINKVGADWQLLAFIDQSYRVNQFKTDPKKLFLFGFDRTVRQKIYLKCWSPQLYILDGIKQYIINLSLKTQKSTFFITNHIMPRQQDIVSLCLEEDRIYLLSDSPIIHSIDRPGLKYVLYEGSLTNINQVMRKKQVQMVIIQVFEEKYERFLSRKSIFIQNEKIYLVGGKGQPQQTMESKYKFERQDYIVQQNKNRFRIKTRRIQCQNLDLQMPNSVVVKQNENFLLYSITYEDSQTQSDESEGIEWKLKIERFTFQNTQTNKVTIGIFKTYVFNQNIEQRFQRYPHANIDEPKFVRIIPYKRFNFSTIREVISKIMWKIDKASGMGQKKIAQLQVLRGLNLQKKEDKQLAQQLYSKWLQYQQLPFGSKSRSQMNIQVNYQQEQLLKDLKHFYQLVTKMILQMHLCLGQPSQNQYMFVVQGRTSKKIKYIAVGPLNTTKLNFFRIKFKNQLFININHHGDESVFYHPTVSGYYKFQSEKLKPGVVTEYKSQEVVSPLKVTIKQ